jgi:hypothetical protein
VGDGGDGGVIFHGSIFGMIRLFRAGVGRGSVHELGDSRVSIWEEDLRTVYTIMDASGKVLHDEISAAVFEGAMPGLYADMETAAAE